MARIKGQVTPYQAGRVPGQRMLDAGHWNMEYEVVKDGRVIGNGAFQANSDGSYAVDVDAPPNSTVRVRSLGGWAYETDETSVRVHSDSDIIETRNLDMREK